MADLNQTIDPDALAAVRGEYQSEVFIFSGSISDENYGKLVTEVSKQPREYQSALMLIATNGGFANSAFRIARLMQTSFRSFALYVPKECYSAGTLVALGANSLLLDSISELGPIDVQLPKKNEIGGRKSGLVSKSAFTSLQETSFEYFENFLLKIVQSSGGTISFTVASQVAGQMAAQLLSPVFAQINPDEIGSDHRDLNVASAYGERLARIGRNVRAGSVQQLVSHYPSHDFIIDEMEAKRLFVKTARPKESLYRLLKSLTPAALTEAAPAVIQKLEIPDAQSPSPTQSVTSTVSTTDQKAKKPRRKSIR